MTEGIMYLPAGAVVSSGDRKKSDRREQRSAEPVAQPLAPWFLDNPVLRSARFDGPDRERRFKAQLEKLMELFASSQIEPAEFRERLVALMASRRP